jgi:hypothetical protein
LACRKLECAANDFRTNSLITFQLNAIERLLCAKVSNASAGNDTLLDGRTGRMQGILGSPHETEKMPSTIKCGVRLTDVRWTWLSGGLTRHFPETIHLSGERPTGEERLPHITYPFKTQPCRKYLQKTNL